MNINVPNIPEANVQGRVLQLQFAPKTSIGAIKEHLSGVLGKRYVNGNGRINVL